MEISQDDLEEAWDTEHPDGSQEGRYLLPRNFVGAFVAKAKLSGHDGLIIRQMSDRDIEADMFLPFAAQQIKSSDNNNGDFDSANTDVRFSLAALDDPIATDDSMSRTPETSFHEWFGASKVVEADGTPKVVYHSTFSSFNEFCKTKDLGFHFGSSFVANKRIEGATKGRGRGDKKLDGVNVMPVYLSIDKPLHLARDPLTWQPEHILKLIGSAIPEEAKIEILQLDEIALGVARAEAKRIKDGGVGVIRKLQPWSGGSTSLELPARTWSRVLTQSREGVYRAITEAVKLAGFDGLTYINEVEGEGRGSSGRMKNPTENLTWVAFDSSQVKSSLGNNGHFDGANNDIRFSLADQEEQTNTEAPCP